MKKFFFIIKLHFRNFESCGKQKLRTSIKLIWFSSPFIKRPRKISTKLFLSLSITFRNYSWEDWKMHYVEWEVTDSIKLPSLSRTVRCQFVIINFFTFLFAHLSISRISLVKQLIIRYIRCIMSMLSYNSIYNSKMKWNLYLQPIKNAPHCEYFRVLWCNSMLIHQARVTFLRKFWKLFKFKLSGFVKSLL